MIGLSLVVIINVVRRPKLRKVGEELKLRGFGNRDAGTWIIHYSTTGGLALGYRGNSGPHVGLGSE